MRGPFPTFVQYLMVETGTLMYAAKVSAVNSCSTSGSLSPEVPPSWRYLVGTCNLTKSAPIFELGRLATNAGQLCWRHHGLRHRGRQGRPGDASADVSRPPAASGRS